MIGMLIEDVICLSLAQRKTKTCQRLKDFPRYLERMFFVESYLKDNGCSFVRSRVASVGKVGNAGEMLDEK